ncbi:hypothetical protein ABN763_13425 [Spongiivirga sp. MCCC 1A20706]|uniref:hypothetical protein n=1 Tax=Spongiivirga sp. MCCC 1A20706 TaxID=3160963 RepID=UPI0039775C45
MKNYLYIGENIGRIFALFSENHVSNWKGYSEDENQDSDYNDLIEIINFDETDLTHYKNRNSDYYIFFSMSTKIEIFKNLNSLLILDGFFFNQKLKTENILEINEVKKLDHKIKIERSRTIIMDAACSGKDINISDKKSGVYGMEKTKVNYYAIVELEPGLYDSKVVDVSVKVENGIDVLSGIKIDKLAPATTSPDSYRGD